MKIVHVIAIALTLLTNAMIAAAQTDSKTLYDEGTAAYRDGDYEKALQSLEKLRSDFPQSARADDALLFIGRIYARTGRVDEASAAFTSLISPSSGSDRARDAAYELALLSYKAREYASVTALLEPLRKEGELDKTDEKILRLLARARQALGNLAWREYRNADARAHLSDAARMYDLLLSRAGVGNERASDLAARGEVYARLSQLSSRAGESRTFARGAEDSLTQAIGAAGSEKEAARLRGVLSSLQAPDHAQLSGSVTALGGAENAAIPGSTFLKPGALITGDVTLQLPLGWRQQLVLDAGFSHDDFNLKTFAYPASFINSGAARIVRSTNGFSGGIAWDAGTRRELFSELGVSGAYTFGDDPSDDVGKLRAFEKLDWRLDPSWKLSLDVDGRWAVYPHYTSTSGRGLDYLQASANPSVTWYLSSDLNLTLGYDFTLKQYLNAKYDQLVSAGPPPVVAPATLDKEYFTHTLSLTLRASPGSVVRPFVGYSFVFNKTANDDVLVIGLPADQFVPGYYDYMEHSLRAGSSFTWNQDFQTTLDGSAAYRSFLSNPAQDAARAFTGGPRTDLLFGLNGEAQYRLWRREQNGFGDLLADVRITYRQSISTMAYEHLLQTNYQTLGAFVGADLEF